MKPPPCHRAPVTNPYCCWKLPPSVVPEISADDHMPSKFRRWMMLATPPTASDPYRADDPSETIYRRSMEASGKDDMTMACTYLSYEQLCTLNCVPAQSGPRPGAGRRQEGER